MNLNKVWLVAKREYITNFRRRSFLFTAFIAPLFSLGMMALVITLAGRVEADKGNFKAIGIIDQANVIALDNGGNPLVELPTPFVLIKGIDKNDTTYQLAKDQLNSGQIDGFYVLNDNYVKTGQVIGIGRESFPPGLTSALTDYLHQAITARITDPDLRARLQEPVVDKQIYRTDNPELPLDTLALVGIFATPFVVGLLIMMTTNATSQFLMAGVADEKENRMMELMITSLRPSEMLTGKILGLGALGITQLLVWAVAGGIVAITQNSISPSRIMSDLQITPGFLLLIVAYFILSYILFGVFMAVVGVVGDNEQEGRQWAGLIVLPSVLPFILLTFFITDPNGAVPTFLSLFPLTAPVSMVFRITWTNVPSWQIILSVVILTISVVISMWAAARIFRFGMLNYGKRLGRKEFFMALRGA